MAKAKQEYNYTSDATGSCLYVEEGTAATRKFEIWHNGKIIYEEVWGYTTTVLGIKVYKSIERYGLSQFLSLSPNQKQFKVGCVWYRQGESLATALAVIEVTIVVPENNATLPSVTVTNITPSDKYLGCYVENLSKISVGISGASGKYGASINSINLIVGDKSYTAVNGSTVIAPVGGNKLGKAVTCEVTDSRGLKRTVNVDTINVYSYIPPKISLLRSIERAQKDENGTITFGDDKQSIYVGAKVECSPLDGSNKCTLKCRKKQGVKGEFGTPRTLFEQENTGKQYNDIVPYETVDKTKIYYVELIAVDSVGNEATFMDSIPSESVFMEKSGIKNTISFGGRAQEDKAVEFHKRGIFYDDIVIANEGKGILINNEANTKTYRLTVDDNGNLSVAAVDQTYSLRRKQ